LTKTLGGRIVPPIAKVTNDAGTMTNDDALEFLRRHKLVAVVRSPDSEKLVDAAEALLDGGIQIVEITMTVPDALDVIRSVRRRLGDRVFLGSGTVLDSATARAALLAGAEFIVSPTFSLDCLRVGHRYGKLVIPGAMTPTEILTAWEAGAKVVKLFPANIGGPEYLRTIAGPLPQIALMPTGGITLENAAEFLRAGACCLGLGSALVETKALADGDFERIRSRARLFVDVVRLLDRAPGRNDLGG
jgi:2-dehydro-3-deoxyphosphogluconate aldolase/(4S)-4-hydroxy-2-oxoglutarate aldolase